MNLREFLQALHYWDFRASIRTLHVPPGTVDSLDGVQEMPVLENLHVSKNMIGTLRPLRDHLALKNLVASACNLTSPEELRRLAALDPDRLMSYLDVSNNYLTTDGFREWQNISLASLHVSHLFAGNCQIQGFSQDRNQNAFLNTLWIPGNNLSKMCRPEQLRWLSNLNLCGNQNFSDLKLFPKLTNLENLWLSRDHTAELWRQVLELPKLQNLFINGVPVPKEDWCNACINLPTSADLPEHFAYAIPELAPPDLTEGSAFTTTLHGGQWPATSIGLVAGAVMPSPIPTAPVIEPCLMPSQRPIRMGRRTDESD